MTDAGEWQERAADRFKEEATGKHLSRESIRVTERGPAGRVKAKEFRAWAVKEIEKQGYATATTTGKTQRDWDLAPTNRAVTSAARWRANRRAHKSARTQYNPCPGTAVPATCIPLLMVTVDICMNRANGMILLDADEEEAWEAQLRIGTGVRSGPKAPDKADESISNENGVFDDMG